MTSGFFVKVNISVFLWLFTSRFGNSQSAFASVKLLERIGLYKLEVLKNYQLELSIHSSIKDPEHSDEFAPKYVYSEEEREAILAAFCSAVGIGVTDRLSKT